MRTVYLAGPIAECRGECVTWRIYAFEKLREMGILGLSPMRAKEHLINEGPMKVAGGYDGILSCQRGLTTRDRWDAMRCDLMLVNFLGAKRVSIGTCIEYGWADAKRIPIVTVIEPEGNIHEHGMIFELTGFKVATLDEALTVIVAIL